MCLFRALYAPKAILWWYYIILYYTILYLVEAEICCEHRVHEIEHARYLLRAKVCLLISEESLVYFVTYFIYIYVYTRHEGVRGSGFMEVFLTLELTGGGGQLHAPAALPS
jgi:hypothetical protein